jgi:hypothetical protein
VIRCKNCRKELLECKENQLIDYYHKNSGMYFCNQNTLRTGKPDMGRAEPMEERITWK